jgi:6-phosphogluconate dehydrogenase
MSRADYFRRQADTCLRLSLISSSEEVTNRLVVMAQDYRTKADAILAESKSPPAEATNHLHDIPKWVIDMWLALTATVLAAAIGFNVLAVAVQHFEQPERPHQL